MAEPTQQGPGTPDAVEKFATSLGALAPLPGDDGRIDIGRAVADFERGLGRTLTPDEYGLVGDRIMEAVVLESLNVDYEEVLPSDGEDRTPGLSDLVDAVIAEHPDWDAAQVKAEVLSRVTTADQGGTA